MRWRQCLAMWLTGLTTEAAIKGAFKAPIIGEEKLKKIDRTRPVMVVTTHLSDSDIQLTAYRLHKTGNLNLVVTNQSTQYQMKDLASGCISLFVKTLGRGWFCPMGWEWGESGLPVPAFNKKDFTRIKKEVFTKNKMLLIAAHNPTFDGKLPDKPGLGAAVVAQMIKNIQIVPAAVLVEGSAPDAYKPGKAIFGRWGRSAKLVIGDVFEIKNRLTEDETDSVLNPERKASEKTREKIKKTAEEIMLKVAKLLPEEKRGIWTSNREDFGTASARYQNTFLPES